MFIPSSQKAKGYEILKGRNNKSIDVMITMVERE
jgi:hypothetical protein